jgi:hypothetical protein
MQNHNNKKELPYLLENIILNILRFYQCLKIVQCSCEIHYKSYKPKKYKISSSDQTGWSLQSSKNVEKNWRIYIQLEARDIGYRTKKTL